MLQPNTRAAQAAPRPSPPTPMPLMAAQGWREATRAALLRVLLGKLWTPPAIAAHLRANGWDATCTAQGLRVEGYLMVHRPQLGWCAVTQGAQGGERRVYPAHACLRLLLAARAWRDDPAEMGGLASMNAPALPYNLMN